MTRRKTALIAVVSAMLGLVVGSIAVGFGLSEIRRSEDKSILRQIPSGTTGVSPDSGVSVEPGTEPVQSPSSGIEPDGLILPGKLVKTASMEVAVGENRLQEATDRVDQMVKSLGGYIARSTSAESSDGKRPMTTLVVRVPADRFEDAIREFRGLGEVLREERNVEDQSSKIQDLEARIRTKEAHRDRLLALMSKAGSVQETLAVEDRLQSVTEELEVLKAKKERLDSNVEYATVSLTLLQDKAAGSRDRRPLPREYLRSAASLFLTTLGLILLAVAPLVAILVVAAPLGFGVRAILRARRRRTRQVADDASAGAG